MNGYYDCFFFYMCSAPTCMQLHYTQMNTMWKNENRLCEKNVSTKKHMHTAYAIRPTFWPKNATTKLCLLFWFPSIINMMAERTQQQPATALRFVCTVNWPINVYLHNSLATNYKQILTIMPKTGAECKYANAQTKVYLHCGFQFINKQQQLTTTMKNVWEIKARKNEEIHWMNCEIAFCIAGGAMHLGTVIDVVAIWRYALTETPIMPIRIISA